MSISIHTGLRLFLKAAGSEAHFSFQPLFWFVIYFVLQFPLSPEAAPPFEEEGKFVLTLDSLLFQVDPNMGARVSSVKLEGQEILYVTGDPLASGSTFWPSPQSWGWPPPSALDSDPYTGYPGPAEL